MRKLLLLSLLMFSSCLAHARTARFVDGTEEGKGVAWICVRDDDKANKGGVECAEMVSVLKATGQTLCNSDLPPVSPSPALP